MVHPRDIAGERKKKPKQTNKQKQKKKTFPVHHDDDEVDEADECVRMFDVLQVADCVKH